MQVSEIHLLTGDHERAGRVRCAACVAPSDPEESTSSPESLLEVACQPRSRPRPSADHLPSMPTPRRRPGASAGSQQVSLQFAARSGVPYSHGKDSLPWRREPPNPETRPRGPILPGQPCPPRLSGGSGVPPGPVGAGFGLQILRAGGEEGASGKREGEEDEWVRRFIKSARHPALPAPGHPGPTLAPGLGGNVRHCFPPNGFQGPRGIC